MEETLYCFEVKKGKKGYYAEITDLYSDGAFFRRDEFALINRETAFRIKEGDLLIGKVIREIKDRRGKVVPIVEPLGYPVTAFIDDSLKTSKGTSKEIVILVGKETLALPLPEAKKLGLCSVYRENLFGFLTQIRINKEAVKKYMENKIKERLFWYENFYTVEYEYGEAPPEVVEDFQQIYWKFSSYISETKRKEELKDELSKLKLLNAAVGEGAEFIYDGPEGSFKVKDGEVFKREVKVYRTPFTDEDGEPITSEEERLIPLDVAILDDRKREEVREKVLREYDRFLVEKESKARSYERQIREIEEELSELRSGEQYLFLENAVKWIKEPWKHGKKLIQELITPSDFETFVDDREALEKALSVYKPKTTAGLLLLFKVTGKRPESLKGINGYKLFERVELFTELEEKIESLYSEYIEPDDGGPEL